MRNVQISLINGIWELSFISEDTLEARRDFPYVERSWFEIFTLIELYCEKGEIIPDDGMLPPKEAA